MENQYKNILLRSKCLKNYRNVAITAQYRFNIFYNAAMENDERNLQKRQCVCAVLSTPNPYQKIIDNNIGQPNPINLILTLKHKTMQNQR